MSANERHDGAAFSWLGEFNTEELSAMLKADSELPNTEESDINTILGIAKEVAEREKQERPDVIPNVEDAWNSFKDNYMPYASGASIYDDSDFAEPIRKRPLRRRRLLRTALMVAATVVFLFACSLAAYALGYDVFGAMAKWTRETFRFENVSTAETENGGNYNEVPEQLAELQALLQEAGVTGSVIPSYIPEGYDVIETSSHNSSNGISFTCTLASGEELIILNCSVYMNGGFSSIYQKSVEDPERYENDGVAYYVMRNVDTYSVAWVTGNNVSCSILGIPSREMAIELIESIQ